LAPSQRDWEYGGSPLQAFGPGTIEDEVDAPKLSQSKESATMDETNQCSSRVRNETNPMAI
jgi:hypothetical protein